MIQYMSVIDCRNSNADDDPERGHMKIDETVYIADGAKLIGDDIQVGNNCIIGAGSLVTEGTVIPDGYMAFGRPAKIVKKLTDEQIDNIRHSAEVYISESAAQFHSGTVREIYRQEE